MRIITNEPSSSGIAANSSIDNFPANPFGKSVSTCNHRSREPSDVERIMDSHIVHLAEFVGSKDCKLDGGSMKTPNFDVSREFAKYQGTSRNNMAYIERKNYLYS
jgi:hypothetical protein